MKKCFSILAALILFPFLSPVKAAGPAIAGHYLTTGQVLVGVTGSAPVANTVTGTANQISVAQGAEGGNLAFSIPSQLTVTNLTVNGTLSPWSTGTLTAANGLNVTYGVNAATAVITNTGATALTVAGGITAGTGVVGIVDTTGKIPAISSAYFASLSGANLTGLPASAITGTAATLAGNTFTGTQVMPTATVTYGVAAATGSFTTSVTTPQISFGAGLAKAAILALPGVAFGNVLACNDCTAVTMCVSTGAAVGAWVKSSDKTARCD